MDISVPKAPTSNLYIFLAVFGLLIVIGSFAYKDHTELAARNKLIEYAKLHSEVNFEIKNFEVDFNSVSEDERKKIINKIDLNMEKLDTLSSVVMAYSKKYDNANKFNLFGAALGFLISFVGFFLWYSRTQKIKDRILENQARPSRLAINKGRAK